MVNLARILVLLLRIVSLGAVLFTFLMAITPFLISPASKLPGTMAESTPAGCFAAFMFIFFLPFSLVPAVVGWFIRERVVRPQEAAERLWWEMEPMREERLSTWTGFLAGLLLYQHEYRGRPGDPVPVRLRSEIPRAFQELDRERRDRLFLFLREAGLEEIAREARSRGMSFLQDPRLVGTSFPRGLVLTAVTGSSLLSAFFLLWAGLIGLTLVVPNPFLEVAGFHYPPAQYVIGLSIALIVALVFGLVAVGLLRMSRQFATPFKLRGRGQTLRELVLRQTLDQLKVLEQWKSMEDASPVVQRIARAVILTAVSELDGEGRGELLRALFAADWLVKGKALSVDGANFRAAELTGAVFPGASLTGADLSGADLSDADLSEADLGRCALRGSDLRSCRLHGANLRHADLRSARLQKAGLEKADLSGALIEGANFWGVDLAGTELSGLQGKAEFFSPATGSV